MVRSNGSWVMSIWDRYTTANIHYLPAALLAGGKIIDISEPT